MTGAHKAVYSFVKERQPGVHLADCSLHLVHIGAKRGAACLPPVEDVLVDVFYCFQKSVNRQTELTHLQELYDTEQRKVLKHACTPCLSIARYVINVFHQRIFLYLSMIIVHVCFNVNVISLFAFV